MADERAAYLQWFEAQKTGLSAALQAQSTQSQASPSAALQAQSTQPQASPAASAYQSYFEQRAAQAAERAALAMEQAFPVGDAVAGVARSAEARQRGLVIPPDLLTSATSELTRRVDAQARRAQLMSSSRLAGWIARDPINAALAQSDLQNLSGLSGLLSQFERGADRLVTDTLGYSRIAKNAEDALAELQDRRADRARPFTEVLADEQKRWSPVGAATLAPWSALARYVSSRMTFVSEDTMKASEALLSDAFEQAIAARDANARRIERTYGTSERVTRMNAALADVSKIKGVGPQMSAIAALAAAEPVAMTEWLVGVALDSAPALIASALVTGLTRNPVLGAAVLGATSYEVSERSAYDQFVREAGYDLRDPGQRAAFVNDPAVRRNMRDRSFAYGATVGLLDAASVGVAGRVLAKNPAGNLILQALVQGVMGGSGELLGELASGQDVNMVEIMAEVFAEFVASPIEVVGVSGRYLREQRGVAQDRAFFNALTTSAKDSTIRAKVPERYRDAVATLTKDGPVESLYVDAQTLDRLFQSDPGGVTAEQFLAAVDGVDIEAYRRARDNGGAVEIPTASYAADIVGTRFDERLRGHIRTAPDRMSATELKAYQARLSELSTQAQEAADKATSGQTDLERVADEARVELVSALRRAGRTSDVAEKEALQAVAFARTMAQRLGIDLKEFLKRYPLAQVQGALESSVAVETPRVTAEVLDRVRAPVEQREGEGKLIKAIRAAAEAASLDLEVAEPADLELAVEQMYGPAAGPVLLNQLGGETLRPAQPGDLGAGVTADFLRRPGWGVVTATRGAETDAAQNAALEAELQARGIAFHKMEGVYKGQSDGVSYMIFADRDTVVELGRKYGQESVLTREGLVFMDGSPTIPLDLNDLVTGDAAKARDFYSTMGDGTTWSAGFAAQTLYQNRDEVLSGDMAGDGRHFTKFFSDVTSGARQQPQRLDAYVPVIDLPQEVKDFAKEREPFSGNFEDHIRTSIPGYREMQDAVGFVISETIGTGALLDIGASEGAMAKAVVQRNPGATAVALDPNVAMQTTFESKPQVEGVVFDLSAYGSAEDAGTVAWTEDDGTAIPFFDPKGKKFDIVHEAMVFQFISNTRGAHVRRAKELLVPGGLFLTFEKLGGPAEEYNANEAKKDRYKAQYYDQETLAAKAREVLQTGGDAVEGMTALQVSVAEMERVLLDNFRYVFQIWDSGNFKGFAASDSYAAVSGFAEKLPSLKSDYATSKTPRRVWEARDDSAKPKVPVNEDGTVTLTHWSDAARGTVDPAFAGTGPLRGAERNVRGPKKAFFGVSVGKPGGYRKESLGPYRHEVRVPAKALYDLTRDPEGLVDAIPDDVPARQRIGWLEERLVERGFKGYIVMDAPQGAAAALFEPVEPVSVRDDRTVELFQSGATPDFFSALTRDVANAKQAKASAKDWKSIIQRLPGIKKAEIDWSGVLAWLDTQEGQVARETVVDFLRRNEVTITPVTLGGEDAVFGEFTVEVDPGEERAYDDDWIEQTARENYLPDLIDERVNEMNESDPGGDFGPDDVSDDEKEALLNRARDMAVQAYYEDPIYEYPVTITQPDGSEESTVITRENDGYYWEGDNYRSQNDVIEAIRDHYTRAYDGPEARGKTVWDKHTEKGGYDYREVLLTVPNLNRAGPNAALDLSPFVKSAHYDVENIVVHARFDYRKSADGKNVLFVEEVQSDLGSYWRDNGPAPTAADVAKMQVLSARRLELSRKRAALHARYNVIASAMLEGHNLEMPRSSSGRTMNALSSHSAPEVLRDVIDKREGLPVRATIGPDSLYSALLGRLADELPRPGESGYEPIAEFLRNQDRRDEISREQDSISDEMTVSMPRQPITPFEGEAYYALMMKKLLKTAAEEGADYLAWTPAYMQARRWSGAVQNVLHEITWYPFGRVEYTREDGSAGIAREIKLTGINGTDWFLVDESNVILEKSREGGRIPESEVVGKSLSELLGGTMAQRVLAEPEGLISGQNIVVGGDGYKIAYDQQIKRFVDKFARRFGSQVRLDRALPEVGPLSDLNTAMLAASQYGFQNTIRLLKETPYLTTGAPLLTAEQWESLEKEMFDERMRRAVQVQDSIQNLEATLAGLEESLASARATGAPPNEVERLEYMRGLTKGRLAVARSTQADLHNPEKSAETLLSSLLVRSVITPKQFFQIMPAELRPESDPVWVVEITPEMRATASEAQPLFQKRPDGARGSILLPTEPGRAPLVTLYQKADLSTFLHESGHYYLHVLQDIIAKGDAPEGMRADWETVLAWWGQNIDLIAKDGGVSEALVASYLRDGTTGDLETDRKVNVGLQETWARAYEAYLLEGKAPSNALRAAFEAFSAWLLSVYRRARGLGVPINDELRGVFDRMLATDEEIAAASTENGFDKLVAENAAQLGIAEEDYQKLVKLSVEAQDETRQEMLRTIMAPLRRARTAEFKAERAEVEAGIRASVNAKPANRVREWLGNARWLGGDAPEQLAGDLRLDRQMLIDEYGEEMLTALPRGSRPLWAKDTGLSADDVAGWFGYRSGSEMLQDLVSSPRAADEIKARTDAEMRKRHGDPLVDGSIEAKAVAALHGEKRGQLLAAELRAIGKAAKIGQVTTRSQAAEVARAAIRAMPVHKAVRSGAYLAAERRAGERAMQAVARGQMDEAYAAKREQLLNYQLYVESKAADEVLAKVESHVAKLKSKSTRSALAGEYLEAIDDILTSYDFRKAVSLRQAQRRSGLLKYVEMMKAAGRENELAIPAYVLDEAKRRPYKTLLLAELEGVFDSLRNIEHTARMKKKLRDAQSERELAAVVDGVVAEIETNLKDHAPNRVATPGEKLRGGLREFANLLLNADTLLRKIGGFDVGAAYEAIKAPIDAAANWAQVEREKAARALEGLYSVYSKAEQRRMATRKHYKELGGAFTKWDLISAALNMGNADNLARLMDTDSGSGFNASQVDFIKQQLDLRDWDFVQSVWDYVNTFWPLIEARERRLTGVVPKKVLASEVETPFGPRAGGYYPIKYRGDVSGLVAAEELAEVQKQMMAGRFGKAQTRHGHLEERARGSGGRVLQLGMEVLHQHVGQVIHDLAFSEAVANSWRVLQDPRVRGAFERKGLLKDHQALEMWLQDTATGQIAAGGVFGRLALRAKNGFTLSKLAFNLGTVAIQLTGVSQSIVTVGAKDMAIGYGIYAANPLRAPREVVKFSSFMRERESTFNRDINDILGDIVVGPAASRYKRFQQGLARVGLWLMQKVQFYGVDVPTWYAAHNQGMRRFGDEAKARAYADRMVARAQASGVFSDRSAFERGTLSRDTRQNGFVRLFTALGSYMFAKGNIAYEVYGRTRRDMTGVNLKTLQAAVRGAVEMTMLFTVEAILYNLIKGTLPGMGEDDDRKWRTFLARETLLSMMSTVPAIRDFGSALSGYEAGAYGSVVETLAKPFVQAAQGEADMPLFKALSSAVGTATGLPSGQLNRVVDAWYRLEKGENVTPVEFIMGRR